MKKMIYIGLVTLSVLGACSKSTDPTKEEVTADASSPVAKALYPNGPDAESGNKAIQEKVRDGVKYWRMGEYALAQQLFTSAKVDTDERVRLEAKWWWGVTASQKNLQVYLEYYANSAAALAACKTALKTQASDATAAMREKYSAAKKLEPQLQYVSELGKLPETEEGMATFIQKNAKP